MDELIPKIYKFEVLKSNSIFLDVDGKANREIAELTHVKENELKTRIEFEIIEDFEDELFSVRVNMTTRIIEMLFNEITPLHTSWELFAFRKKGIQITADYYIRLVETM